MDSQLKNKLKEFKFTDIEKSNRKKRAIGWFIGIVLAIAIVIIFSLSVNFYRDILLKVGAVLFGAELILLSIVELLYHDKKFEIGTKILYAEFDKEHEKIEISDSIIEDVKSDFYQIVEYNLKAIKSSTESSPIENIAQYRIKGKGVYLGKYNYVYRAFRANNVCVMPYIVVATKLEIPERLCISIIETGELEDAESYISEFDNSNFSKLSSKLSEDFYHANFKEIENAQYLKDKKLKIKLQYIAQNYDISFKISLKDGLFCMVLRENTDIEKLAGRAYLEHSAIKEILEVFFEYENNRIGDNNG